MTKIEVRCYVDSCTFWKGNICTAGAIEVASEDAEKTPHRSDHTMCNTFKERKPEM
ncbi:DUF1540 domain-containing protein [Zhaonella formicivorans]|uniref:DUF1540 domain-containing protein n=1 Tax=Zhaonella formicivorans TaxID=2528593 RepID=UPI001D12B2A7|nr:DUF1540 domain-containing protein [Zhaonella formicivorans]